MTSKRGQAGPAAGLVAIIALLIVIYILLLPADVRDQLLNGTTTKESTSKDNTLEKNVLIFEHPGTLDPVRLRDREKILDSFNLYSEKSAVVLKSQESVHLENGWLRSKTYNLSFNVNDISNTDNYILAFDVANSQGRVIAVLNGEEIFNGEVSIGNAEPIKMNRDLIKSKNSLILSVSGVGLAFWSLNEYDLRNVRAIADFIDVSKKEYKNFFIISATEKQNFEKTELHFVPNCLTKNVGPLKITINDKQLNYQAVPDCGLLSNIAFDPNLLKQGENSITFRAEEGNYFVDRVSIKADLKTQNYPFYYFEIKPKDFKLVENRTANVTVELSFADTEDKLGEINVNGHLTSLDTSNSSYVKNVNLFVEEDQNYLQIVPKTILNIVDLKVVLNK